MPTLRTPFGPIEFEPPPVSDRSQRLPLPAPYEPKLLTAPELMKTNWARALPPPNAPEMALVKAAELSRLRTENADLATVVQAQAHNLCDLRKALEKDHEEAKTVIAFQREVLDAQGKNIAELKLALETRISELQGLAISNDRAVARVAELEDLLQAASDKPAPSPPAPAADPAPAPKNPEAFARSAEDRARQDKAVGRWASR